MNNHTIFAWTGPTPPEGYPPFVNISRDEHGKHSVTVRGPGDGGRQIACATIPVEALEALLGDLAADLYRDDSPAATPAPSSRISGDAEIDRDTDGELLIDWSPGKGRMLSMTLRDDGRLSYAFTWDGEKAHGTAQMPPRISGDGPVSRENSRRPTREWYEARIAEMQEAEDAAGGVLAAGGFAGVPCTMPEGEATHALRMVQEMWDELDRRKLNPILMRQYSDALSVLEAALSKGHRGQDCEGNGQGDSK